MTRIVTRLLAWWRRRGTHAHCRRKGCFIAEAAVRSRAYRDRLTADPPDPYTDDVAAGRTP